MSASQNQLVSVAGKTVAKIEYKGMPVVTFKMIDEFHGNANEDASKRFYKNKKQFIEGQDYFPILSGEARQLGINAPNGLNLLTESGYLKLVKTFTDDLAWEIQGQLVDCYFHRKNAIVPVVPTPASTSSHLALAELMLAEMKAQALQTQQNTADIQHLKQNLRLEHWQQKALQDCVKGKVKEFEQYKPSAFLFPAIWHAHNNKFQIPRYNELPAEKFDEAVKFIKSLTPFDLI